MKQYAGTFGGTLATQLSEKRETDSAREKFEMYRHNRRAQVLSVFPDVESVAALRSQLVNREEDSQFTVSNELVDLVSNLVRKYPDLQSAFMLCSRRAPRVALTLESETIGDALVERFIDSLGIRARELRRSGGRNAQITISSAQRLPEARLLELAGQQFGPFGARDEFKYVLTRLVSSFHNWATANPVMARKFGIEVCMGEMRLLAQLPVSI